MNIVQEVSKLIGKKPQEMTVEDVRKALPDARRTVTKWDRETSASGRKAAELQEKAFLTENNPTEQAALLRKAAMENKKAQTCARNSQLFIRNLSNLENMEMHMQMVDEMRQAGLINDGKQIKDWEGIIDTMTAEVSGIADAVQSMEDVISSVLPEGSMTENTGAEAVQKELESLFMEFNAAKQSNDLEKQEELKAQIEVKQQELMRVV